MKIIKTDSWVYYVKEGPCSLLPKKCGKWMYFFKDKKFVKNICHRAIEEDIVEACKYRNLETGVVCFYLNGDDTKRHKKVIDFFIKNELIRKTKNGKLYNISFKYDSQTLEGKYGKEFKPDITLDKFINLETGEWLNA